MKKVSKKNKTLKQMISDIIKQINNANRRLNLGVGSAGPKYPKNGINDGSQYKYGGKI